jgi:hypothetical protein
MESVAMKYRNFQAFIKEVVPAHARFDPLIIKMESAPVSLFLATLYAKKDEDKLRVIEDLLKQMSLDIRDIDPKHLEKLNRYIDFFTQVSEKMPRI